VVAICGGQESALLGCALCLAADAEAVHPAAQQIDDSVLEDDVVVELVWTNVGECREGRYALEVGAAVELGEVAFQSAVVQPCRAAENGVAVGRCGEDAVPELAVADVGVAGEVDVTGARKDVSGVALKGRIAKCPKGDLRQDAVIHISVIQHT
jgi:hypothetical protein